MSRDAEKFSMPRGKNANKAPCFCDCSEQKEQRARESGGTESGGNLRPLVSVTAASRRSKEQGNLGELNLEAILEPF